MALEYISQIHLCIVSLEHIIFFALKRFLLPDLWFALSSNAGKKENEALLKVNISSYCGIV